MTMKPRYFALCACVIAILAATACGAPVDRPLPSWRDGATRQAVIDFVTAVTDEGGPQFVPGAERIAVFDNDGTLWSEQPFYFQLAFTMDRVKDMAAEHPEWRSEQPFQAVLEGDLAALHEQGKDGLMKLVMATHAGIAPEDLQAAAAEWLAEARHPRFDRPYTDLVFQPMLELLEYLRANGFRTWIVSGGGIGFLRVFAEEVYGIPPEQVIGSSTEVVWDEEEAELRAEPTLGFYNDKGGKAVGINLHIGRRPLMAFGNSDGDHQMLRYTAAGPGPRFCALVHHTDSEREWAYDRRSSIGGLDKAWDDALERGWTMIDMQKDWAVVYPFETP
jgi:phosphoglycolate phosphatase-like HAD superfamily hydrolase